MALKKHLTFIRITCAVLVLFLLNCGEKPVQKDLGFQIISEIKNDKSSPFYIDFAKFPVKREPLPIGVFDSGTGGLTVLNSILTLDKFNNKTHQAGADGIPDFQTEYFIYLGDKANMPYGRYDSEGKSDFLKELIIKDVQFLLGTNYYASPTDTVPKTDKKAVKTIVIACNTATAFGYDLIQKSLAEWGLDMNVLGIIDAGAMAAVESLEDGENPGKEQTVGVFATEGTCATNGYPKAVKKYFASAFGRENIGVVQRAGFGLAAAIDGDPNYIDPKADAVRGKEKYFGPGLNHPKYPIDPNLWKEYNFNEGNELLIRKDSEGNIAEVELNSVANYIKYHVTHLAVEMVAKYPDRKLDSVILGCTHYPFFENELKEHFIYLKQLSQKYDAIIPEDFVLIDPALSLAVELYEYLSRHRLTGPTGNGNKQSEFYISVPNRDLAENRIDEAGEFPFDYKYGRSIDTGFQFVKRVPFSEKRLSKDILERIKIKMPRIYEIIPGIETGSKRP
jgi:glutamate racemase